MCMWRSYSRGAENRSADGNCNTAQDTWDFLGRVVETMVKCQHVSKERLIL